MATPLSSEKVVLVGQKPTMNYVTACVTFFNSGADKVIVKARGLAISNAIDAVQLLRRGFIKDLEIVKIDLGTQELSGTEGQRSRVSIIEITIAKPSSKAKKQG